MVNNVEEALEVYKAQVREYLKKCTEIDEVSRKACHAAGKTYCGSLGWPKSEWEWKRNTEFCLHGMTIVLGLSEKEINDIWDTIKTALKS